MFSAKKKSLGYGRPKAPRRGGSFFGRLKRGFRPRIGIKIWLTALFMLVTAFAAIAAYEIVRPILVDTLDRASNRAFEQVGEQFQQTLERRGGNVTLPEVQSFAAGRGLQWGFVRADDGTQMGGQLRGSLDPWLAGAVNEAVETRQPAQRIESVPPGSPREGQIQATYAAPITVNGEDGVAIVFNKFFTESDVENVDEAIENIDRLALIAFGLALLISGVSGYIVATIISRRISRLGLAAERLAAGNFEERISTRVEDEVGALGATFNSMAYSLQGAFEQVEQEKERGQAILDGMTDAVIGVDRELNAVFLNPKARKLLDGSDMEFQTRLQEILAKTRYSGPVTESESEAGDAIIEIRAAPLEDGALAILRDVTEERHIERAKAEFIANASHELKTPLSAISGYLEMLEDEGDDSVRRDFMEEIRTQTKRLQDLARTLLDLSKLDANAVIFRDEEVYLEDMLHELKRDFSYTGRPIRIDSESDIPPIETDSSQLHRALTILVDNAIKYSEDGSPVGLDLHRENGNAIVSVSDNGCGIPESEVPRIFDRFYRAQGSSRADGTGLGLALAHEITTHLGGDIHVKSEPNAGSTFSLTLPLEENAPKPRRTEKVS
jgi:signal transduction histidine kinase